MPLNFPLSMLPLAMSQAIPLPRALRIVAYVFLIQGAGALIEILLSLSSGTPSINLGLLNLFIGLGILKLRASWRTLGLAFLWIGMIGGPLALVLILTSDVQPVFAFYGWEFGPASKPPAVASSLAFIALAIWQYRVLTRAEVRCLFGLRTPETDLEAKYKPTQS